MWYKDPTLQLESFSINQIQSTACLIQISKSRDFLLYRILLNNLKAFVIRNKG